MSKKKIVAVKTRDKETLNIVNWHSALKTAPADPTTGIKRVPLAGDTKIMVGVVELQPGRKMEAHVHNNGIEIFHTLKGRGEVYTGSQEGEIVFWNDPLKIKAGDVFSIEPGMVHQLRNLSDKQSLFLTFSCPLSHFCADLTLVEGFPINTG
jgi:quercetin dioxygenase-like cupin family protein